MFHEFICEFWCTKVPYGGALAVITYSRRRQARPRLGPPLLPWFPLLAVTPTMPLRLVGGSSPSSDSLALVSWAVREGWGKYIFRPRSSRDNKSMQ